MTEKEKALDRFVGHADSASVVHVEGTMERLKELKKEMEKRKNSKKGIDE